MDVTFLRRKIMDRDLFAFVLGLVLFVACMIAFIFTVTHLTRDIYTVQPCEELCEARDEIGKVVGDEECFCVNPDTKVITPLDVERIDAQVELK